MTQEEEGAFERRYGYKPTFYKIALDALAIFVNPKNPIREMTLQQVDGIFSITRKRGGGDIESWGAVGLSGDWGDKAITLYGRDRLSGTHDYFIEHALEAGEFKPTVHEELS
jgi:phosphate transport system substrate-binding protein